MKFETRIKISALWLLMTLSLLVHGQLHFFESGAVPKMSEAMLIFFALCYLIPMVMAFLTLVLKNLLNHRLNLIVGVIFLCMNIYHFWGHISEPHQLPIIGATVVSAILIIFYSSRKRKETTPNEV